MGHCRAVDSEVGTCSVATQTKNFLSSFRLSAEGWGEEPSKECKEIFGFARASTRAQPRRLSAHAERTI